MSEAQEEPSIEDILASIRKIITDDDAPADGDEAGDVSAAASAPSGKVEASDAADDDVLELTEIVEEETAVSSEEETTDPFEAVQAAMQKSDAEEEGAAAASPPPEEKAAPAPSSPAPSGASAPESELVSSPAASAAVNSFSKITAQQKASEMAALESISGPPVSGRSLDGIVQEMLRPMLKEWLDNNLPEMVERLVQRELHKMIRLAQDDF